METGGPGAGSVSCTGPTDCTGISANAVQTLSEGVWQPPQTLDIEVGGPVAGGGSSQISCSDALDCTAVGLSTSSSEPAVVTETDGTWGPVQALATVGGSGTGNQLSSVSCSDALDCTAVGSYYPESDVTNVPQPAAATESNGVWGPLTGVSGPSLDDGASFTSVSCMSIGNCVAVGFGYGTSTDSYFHPLAAAETNGVWDDYQVGPTDIVGPTSVSCVDALHCTAVGGEFDGGGALVFSVAGGSIGAPVVIGSGWLTAVDCTDANDCVAVNNSPGTDLYMVESDGVWAPVPVANQDGWLSSVSCTSVSDCTAIGATQTYVITNTPTVSVADNAPIVGHDLTFTATVTGTNDPAPIGAVAWTVGGPGGPSCSSTTGPVSSGNVSTYTCTVTGEPVGSFSATASFGGDAQYAAASGADNDATVASVGGTLALGKNKNLYGNQVMQVAGSGWNLNGDTAVTLYQCATATYQSGTCDQATKITATVGTGKKAGTFKKAKLHLAVDSIDTRGNTCGLATSAPCYVVAVGSTGDEGASAALIFKPPSATLKATSNVVANNVDKVTAAYFPTGDTVIAEECDSSVMVPTTLSSNCNPSTKVTGTTNAKGKVTFSSAGVIVVDGGSYTESGSGTVSAGGHADIVIYDTTTSGAFVVVPITLHA